jgi:archaetidylinositol phosphate synthase
MLRPALEKMGKGFASTGLSPNFWTIIGLVFALASALIYGLGIEFGLIIGGVLLLVSGFFDMVDGQVARVTGRTSKKGGYLDSMFDKIAETAIFLGILIGGYAEPYLVLLAITLSLLVSYASVGIGERAERLLVIAIIGIIGFMDIAVIIVVIIAAITLIQRMIVTAKNIEE